MSFLTLVKILTGCSILSDKIFVTKRERERKEGHEHLNEFHSHVQNASLG